MVLTRATRDFKQKRAQATYQRLLDAAEVVFAKHGFDGAQTPKIAAEAGVSTGALYRYFADKRQAFVEMVARSLGRVQEEILSKLDPALFRSTDRRLAIDTAIDVLFARVHRDASLERVYLAVSLRDPEVAQLRADFERNGLDALTLLISSIVPRDVVPSPRAAALVIEIASLEVASECAGLRPRLDDTIPDRDVRSELRQMLHRYLFPSETALPPLPPSPSRSPSERRKRARPASQRG